jgi:hypothetical protein
MRASIRSDGTQFISASHAACSNRWSGIPNRPFGRNKQRQRRLSIGGDLLGRLPAPLAGVFGELSPTVRL